MVVNTYRYIPLRVVSKMVMGPTILQKDLSISGIPVYSAGYKNEAWGFTDRPVKTYPKGTIIVSARGSIGFPKIPDHDIFTSTQTTIALQSSNLIDKKYLLYFLMSVNWQELVSGVAIPMLTISRLGELLVPILPFEEQQNVVTKLDNLLRGITVIKDHLDNITNMHIKLVQSSFVSDYDTQSKHKLGENINECTESIGNKWHSIPKIGVNKDDGIVELRTSKQTGFERYKIVKKGYLVYNPMRVNIGSVALYEKDEIAITSPDYIVFKTKNSIPPVVMLSFLKSPQGLMEINNNTQGAVRERLYFNQLCNINISTSLIENAAKYGPVFEWFYKFNSIKPKIEDKLSKLEQSILAKAFRGESLENEVPK